MPDSDPSPPPRATIPLRRYWRLLVRYLRPQRGWFALLCALLLAGIALQIAIPQITRHFIDAARGGSPELLLLYAAGGFIIAAVFQQLLTVAAAYLGASVAWRATNGLREDLFGHALRLDMGYHNDVSAGELIERIDGDVTVLATFFSQLVIVFVGNLLLLNGVLIALYVEGVAIGAAFTAFSALALIALARVREIAVPFEKARMQATAELFAFLEERLGGTEDLRAVGAEDYAIDRLYAHHHALLGHWRDAHFRYWIIGCVGSAVGMLGYALSIGLGWWLFRSGQITQGAVYMLIHYTHLISRPFREITQQLESLQGVGASIERLEDLLAHDPQITDGPGAELPGGALGLQFEDASFAYSEEPVLQELNLELPPGQVLGLLGRTGSGKSTTARLALRLHDVGGGRVRIGGVDVREPTLAQLRGRVAMVTQEVQLFRASVRDNVTLFDDSIGDERIIEVLAQLELKPWLDSLPDGLDSEIEAGSRNLSAGEAQLLAFARVFLRDPGLLVLDEASSRLDPATEQKIERALDRLLQGRTCVLIAHHLKTVERADRIAILERGRLIEQGDRLELASDPTSRFSELLRTGLREESAA